MSKLKLEGVSYTYGIGTPFEKKALNDVNIEFSENKITGLIGHTGSGKSTLAQLLNGLIKPDGGKILLDGKDIWENPKQIGAVRFRVGLVFQYPEYQLFEETVYKDIAFGPLNMKKSAEEQDALVKNAARFTDISEELLQKSPFELSGGQKRRVAIAGVIAMNPDILVLDEPAAGLDPRGRDEILTRIREYQKADKKTVILISHSMEDMARYADELAVMKEGSVFLHGTVSEVFKNPEKIEETGLSLPRISKLMRRLELEGLPVNGSVYTVRDAYESILAALGSGDNGKQGEVRTIL